MIEGMIEGMIACIVLCLSRSMHMGDTQMLM